MLVLDIVDDPATVRARRLGDRPQLLDMQIMCSTYMVFSIELDEKDQMLSIYCVYNRFWKDEFLTWDPMEYDNISLLSFPTDKIWMPDVQINEYLESEKATEHNFVYVNYTGLVNYQKAFRLAAMCRFSIYYFPFDQHNCTLSFQSQLHAELIFTQINFRRHPIYYVVNLIIPSAFLIIMDIVGFYIPPQSGERISFKITLLLGYSVFLVIVSETLPVSPQGTSVIAVYFLVCMALLVISLTESIVIVRLVNRKNIQSQVPKWLKKLILGNMTTWLHMKDKSRYFPPNIDSSDALQETGTTSTDTGVSRDRVQTTIRGTNHRFTDPAQMMLRSSDQDTCDELSKCSENGGSFVTSPVTVSITEQPEILRRILNEIVSLRQHLQREDDQENSKEWLLVAFVLDKFLFWVYLMVILIFAVCLATSWSHYYI
ncbi:unnamed protein product [Ranitomeya imitator]|uniref:5-hydroxytryptamine receptor 3A n=1 Tax=Ranitomeya imitator TaxID=111125 RepID=A0ABN9LGL4_9NEOB|nr:unnamed protein product [Ranitomeya imitator]